MNIGILSRGPGLYSTQSLYRACLARDLEPRLIDYSRCSLLLHQDGARIYYRDQPLPRPDGIVPRIAASFTQEGAALIRHFETMGVVSTTPAEALVRARDKLRSLQRLAHKGVDVPVTVFAEPNADLRLIVEQVGGFPCIVKDIESTHGMGVQLVHDLAELRATLYEPFQTDRPVIIQEFVAEAKGEDVRVFVVGDRVVGAMKRVARTGEFRSNLHQGGVAYNARLTELGEEVALQAARALRLPVAGVDILESRRGPLLLEVNASPGLEGIEKVTRQDIAGAIIDYLVERIASDEEE